MVLGQIPASRSSSSRSCVKSAFNSSNVFMRCSFQEPKLSTPCSSPPLARCPARQDRDVSIYSTAPVLDAQETIFRTCRHPDRLVVVLPQQRDRQEFPFCLLPRR